MKLNVTANLQFGRGKTFMKGIYEGDNIPKELIAEMKSGSRHISEVEVPNIKTTAKTKTKAKPKPTSKPRQTVRKAPAKKK